jgi:HSP20 family protein
MSLVRWEPWKELERYFGYGPRFTKEMTMAEWMPTVDIEENTEEFLVKAELPGLKKEDVRVTYKDGVLALSGERKQEKEEKGKKFHRIERTYGSFYRSFMIPDDVDEKKIIAEQKDGLVYIHLPKTFEKKPDEKAIEVKVR